MNNAKQNTDLAFQALMQENNPLHKQYDSGCDGILPECRTCRFHRPHWKYETCVFKFCPYTKDQVSTARPDTDEEVAA